MDPTDTDPIALLEPVGAPAELVHPADDLVARYDGQHRRWRPAFDFVEFRMTHSAGGHLQPYFTSVRLRDRNVDQIQGGLIVVQGYDPADDHCSHDVHHARLVDRLCTA